MDRVRVTPLGQWLAKKAPDVLLTVGGLIAEKAVWPLIQKLLNRRRLSAADMEHAKTLADASLKNVRADLWKHDNKHGSSLAKNARPLITLACVLGGLAVTILQSTGYQVSELWQGVWATLSISTVGAYFIIQTYDNGRPNAHNKRSRRKLHSRRTT